MRARIVEWPRPQSSVQTSVYVPVLIGSTRTFVTIRARRPSSIRNSGTQKEWITSFA